MEERWTIKFYISVSGKNYAEEWLSEQDDKVQAKIDYIIRYLEITEPARWGKYYKKLKGYDDLHELIIQAQGDPYRLFGCFGPGRKEFTVFCCAKEVGRKQYLPPKAPDIAERLRKRFINGEGKTDAYKGPKNKT